MLKRTHIINLIVILSILLFVGCSNKSDNRDDHGNTNDNGVIDIGSQSSNIVDPNNGGDSATQEGASDVADNASGDENGGSGESNNAGGKSTDGIEDAGDAVEEDAYKANREQIIADIQSSMIKSFEEAPDPYLIGWTYSLKVSGLTEEQKDSFDVTSLFESMVVSKEFEYNVGIPLKVANTASVVYMAVGKTHDFSDPFASQSSVNASNSSHTVSHKGPEDLVFEKDNVTVHISSIITSSNVVDFNEVVEVEGWGTVNGTINFKRLGPGSRDNQKDIDVDGQVTDSIVDATIPQGDYALVFKRDDIGFEVVVDNDYIFLVDEHKTISLMGLNTVEGHVYKGSATDENKKPVKDSHVELIPLITDVDIEGEFTDTTDENGLYSIPDVPIGIYQVVVDGVVQHTITINTLGNNDVTSPDVYKPGDIYDVTILMVMERSTIQIEFKKIHIGMDYAEPMNMFPGVSIITKEKDTPPDTTTILSQKVPATPVYWENYFHVLKTDDTASGYLKPNTYYLDWSFGVDWHETEYGLPEWGDGDNQSLPFMANDMFSGEVDTAAFEALLNNGTPFVTHHYIDLLADSTITIVPHED